MGMNPHWLVYLTGTPRHMHSMLALIPIYNTDRPVGKLSLLLNCTNVTLSYSQYKMKCFKQLDLLHTGGC